MVDQDTATWILDNPPYLLCHVQPPNFVYGLDIGHNNTQSTSIACVSNSSVCVYIYTVWGYFYYVGIKWYRNGIVGRNRMREWMKWNCDAIHSFDDKRPRKGMRIILCFGWFNYEKN